MLAGPARGKGSVFSLFWNPPSIVISFRLGWNSLPTLQTDVSANLIKKTWSFLLRLASLIFFIGLIIILIFAACFSHDIHWTNDNNILYIATWVNLDLCCSDLKHHVYLRFASSKKCLLGEGGPTLNGKCHEEWPLFLEPFHEWPCSLNSELIMTKTAFWILVKFLLMIATDSLIWFSMEL